MPTPYNLYVSYAWPEPWAPKGVSGWGQGRLAMKDGYRHVLPFEPKPWTQPLWYDGRVARGECTLVGECPAGYHPWWYWAPAPFSSRHRWSGNDFYLNTVPVYGRETYNKAYERLLELIRGPAASWGASVGEGRETLEAIAKRASQLRRSYKALRRGEFRKSLKELGVNPKRKHKNLVRSASHEASGLWLEYHFGWSPILGEIYQSTLALTVPPILDERRYFATAKQELPKSTISGFADWTTEAGVYRVRMGTTVRITNLNVAQANALGLINPLAVAWELVPFSFVADWFANLGNMIESLTDLAGFSLRESYQTQYLKCESECNTRSEWGIPGDKFTYVYRTNQVKRRIGLPRPVWVYPVLSNFGNSIQRTATAVSLLTVLFIKDK